MHLVLRCTGNGWGDLILFLFASSLPPLPSVLLSCSARELIALFLAPGHLVFFAIVIFLLLSTAVWIRWTELAFAKECTRCSG